MTIEQAKQKILSTINAPKESIDHYIIDEQNIVRHDFSWYIPFNKKNHIEKNDGGAWNDFLCISFLT